MLFEFLHKGNGAKSPLPSTPCAVHYKGTLINGTQFDATDDGEPATFAPNEVIKGWTEALQLMTEGDKWRVFLPFELAYGTEGAPPDIPPCSTLVFEMELVKVNGPGQKADAAKAALLRKTGKPYEAL